MEFKVIKRGSYVPDTGINTAYLSVDNWNDYSFVTSFLLTLHDEHGVFHEIGNVKIGYKGQVAENSTHSTLSTTFPRLDDIYFSLGTDLQYYKNLVDLPVQIKNTILSSLNDVAHDDRHLNIAIEEEVFSTSLLRGVSLSSVKGQFRRILAGDAPLTNFRFSYKRPQAENIAGISLSFEVVAESKPSTNIHALIGRNGVGKTTLLNGMIKTITQPQEETHGFYNDEIFGAALSSDYFSSLVSVSFSAFDPFVPPAEQRNPALGTCYHYIGLKNAGSETNITLKAPSALHAEFIDALSLCMSETSKKQRWLKAIKTLESDDNFAEINLPRLASLSIDDIEAEALPIIRSLSSGHEVVLLTVTKLVATVEEKTLLLIDEPECHLHPPLLSAFLRALSELLHHRNGVAIIATHSPVVLQEVPKSCAWKITRSGDAISTARPNIQTFGENLGVLTREVFGLEVANSGFHDVLSKSVTKGGSFDEIMASFNGQLGFEGQAILRAQILNRDRG